MLVLCNVNIRSHPLYEQQDHVIFPLNGEGLEPIRLSRKCHSGHVMELCDECSNCKSFQFHTEKVFRDIPFFCDFTSFCLHCEVTAHLIFINENLEKLGNQECYHNKINAILYHFESSFE